MKAVDLGVGGGKTNLSFCNFQERSVFPQMLFVYGIIKKESLQESAGISENLRLGSVCPLCFFVVFLESDLM